MEAKKLYDSITIGAACRILDGSSNPSGVIMDKYPAANNVYVDILLNNGQIIERKAFMSGEKAVVELT